MISVVGMPVKADAQTGATTGAAHSLYGRLLMQSGMLQYKLDVIITTILFSILNIPRNWQIIIFTKIHQYMTDMHYFASVNIGACRRAMTSGFENISQSED